jgi:hypothetical protein
MENAPHGNGTEERGLLENAANLTGVTLGRDDQPQVFKLTQPIEFEGEKVSEITLQPLKGKVMRHVAMPIGSQDAAAMMSTPDWYLKVAAAASGRPSEFFDELAGPDVLRLMVLVLGMQGNFFSGTGGKPSRL